MLIDFPRRSIEICLLFVFALLLSKPALACNDGDAKIVERNDGSELTQLCMCGAWYPSVVMQEVPFCSGWKTTNVEEWDYVVIRNDGAHCRRKCAVHQTSHIEKEYFSPTSWDDGQCPPDGREPGEKFKKGCINNYEKKYLVVQYRIRDFKGCDSFFEEFSIFTKIWFKPEPLYCSDEETISGYFMRPRVLENRIVPPVV